MALRRVSGELIKRRRKTLKLTQQAVADLSEGAFSRANISQWELDLNKPDEDNTLALCKALGCKYEAISFVVVPKTAENTAAAGS